MSDFEAAVINAIRRTFPGVVIGGCYFHFIQNQWKYIQRIGLSGPYDHNPDLKTCINHCFALGFLPLNQIINVFTVFINNPRTQQLVQQYPNLQNFFIYLWNTYIAPNSIFPGNLWNVYNRSMSERTNNVVESYHGRWNSEVGVRHPNLWVLLRKVKDAQALSHNSLINAQNGYPPITRKLKWRNLERDVNLAKGRYRLGQRNIYQYWGEVSRLMTAAR